MQAVELLPTGKALPEHIIERLWRHSCDALPQALNRRKSSNRTSVSNPFRGPVLGTVAQSRNEKVSKQPLAIQQNQGLFGGLAEGRLEPDHLRTELDSYIQAGQKALVRLQRGLDVRNGFQWLACDGSPELVEP